MEEERRERRRTVGVEEGRMEGSRGVSEGESRVGVAASPLDCY